MSRLLTRLAALAALVVLSGAPAAAQTSTVDGSGTTAAAGSGTVQLGTQWLMLFGDSKTGVVGTLSRWQEPLALAGEVRTGRVWTALNAGLGGATVPSTLAALPGYLASMPVVTGATDIRCLVNLGANDMNQGMTQTEAAFITSYLAILDAIHAKWPAARLYVMRAWMLAHDADADTLAGRMATIVAARASFVSLGPDERIWLKGADNGTTMSYDGTHYSPIGNQTATAQWAAVLWP